jgi:hypothetical protein
VILAVFIVLGILSGLLLGGRVSNLSHFRLRGEWVAIAALLTQVLARGPVGDTVPLWQRLAIWTLAVVVALGVCIANFRRLGIPLVALGLALNLIVVLANVGMPVGTDAIALLSREAAGYSLTASAGFYHEATRQTRLLPLADIIPLPGPRPLRAAFSLGDAALWLGIAMVVAGGMLEHEKVPGPGIRDAWTTPDTRDDV